MQLTRQVIPSVIYLVTAIFCWFAPSSIEVTERYRIVNVAPTGAFAIASSALALVHVMFRIVGPLAVTGASIWAALAASFTMGFAAELLPAALWRWPPALQMIGLVAITCAFLLLSWHVGRGRLAPAIHWVPRGVVAVGFVLMASVYGELAWSGIAVLVGIDTPTGGGIEAAAQFLAELTISLWFCTAVFVLGAVVHAIVLIVRRP
jgi:hypothetical protein